MKYSSTLLFVLVLTNLIYAQEIPSTPSPSDWSSPMSIFQAEMIHGNNVSTVKMQSVGTAALRGGGSYPYQEAKIYQMDREGHLVNLTEMEEGDTVRVSQYSYVNGLRNWETVEDRSWKKKYKIGYRFNSHQQIYQVKSYEIINDEDIMLLDTRNYVYNANGKLQAIRFIEHDRLVKLRTYAYDREGLTTGIFEVDADNTPLRSTMFTYDSKGRFTLVSHQNTAESSQQEYRYIYTPEGNLREIHWKENGIFKGKAIYSYNAEQRLVEMRTEMTPELEEHTLLTVIEYANNDYY